MHFFQLVFKNNNIIKLKSQFCGDGCYNLLWVGSPLLGTGIILFILGTGIKIQSIHSWNWCYPMHTWNLFGLGFVVLWSIIRKPGGFICCSGTGTVDGIFSGKILHIDFGDCFEASMNREKFPEKVSVFFCLNSLFVFLELIVYLKLKSFLVLLVQAVTQGTSESSLCGD